MVFLPLLVYIGIQSGVYRYTGDLLSLDYCPVLPVLSHALLQVVTISLNVSVWQAALAVHPDSIYRDFIISGLTEGFQIGFKCDQRLFSSKSNMRSAILNPAVIDEYLTKERAAGRFIGPLSPEVDVHLSHFGVIPKGHIPGKWRLITDLSYPPGLSVNDGIDNELCSLKYVTVDIVAGMVAMLGPASLMAKVDIQSAYRLIPVHPDDCPLLGVRWSDVVLAMSCYHLSCALRLSCLTL